MGFFRAGIYPPRREGPKGGHLGAILGVFGIGRITGGRPFGPHFGSLTEGYLTLGLWGPGNCCGGLVLEGNPFLPRVAGFFGRPFLCLAFWGHRPGSLGFPGPLPRNGGFALWVISPLDLNLGASHPGWGHRVYPGSGLDTPGGPGVFSRKGCPGFFNQTKGTDPGFILKSTSFRRPV